MINSQGLTTKVKVGNKEIISSGIVHTHEPQLEIQISDLSFKFLFKSDSKETRYDTTTGEKTLNFNLYNFNSSLGQGLLNAAEVGTLDGKKLFLTFFISTSNGGAREFTYTFLTQEG